MLRCAGPMPRPAAVPCRSTTPKRRRPGPIRRDRRYGGAPAEGEQQGLERRSGRAVEQVKRQPGEPRTCREQGQAGRARAQDRAHSPVELVESRRQGRPFRAGVGRSVEVDPEPCDGAEPEFNLGEGGVDRLDGVRDDGLRPQRRRAHAEAAGGLPGYLSGTWLLKTAEAAGRR